MYVDPTGYGFFSWIKGFFKKVVKGFVDGIGSFIDGVTGAVVGAGLGFLAGGIPGAFIGGWLGGSFGAGMGGAIQHGQNPWMGGLQGLGHGVLAAPFVAAGFVMGGVPGAIAGGSLYSSLAAKVQGASWEDAAVAGIVTAGYSAAAYGGVKVVRSALRTSAKPRASFGQPKLRIRYDVEGKPKSIEFNYGKSKPRVGSKVYRVYDQGPYNKSWTPIDPRSVPNYAKSAGLYNKGRFLIEGTLMDDVGVGYRRALPGPGGTGGGLPEWIIPDAESQVRVDNVYGLNPEFN